QRDLERILDIAHERGQPIEAGELGGTESALAGEELEALGDTPHDDRLDQPVRLDRGCELPELLVVEVLAGLVRIRADVAQRQKRETRPLPLLETTRHRESSDRRCLALPLARLRHAPPHLPPPPYAVAVELLPGWTFRCPVGP